VGAVDAEHLFILGVLLVSSLLNVAYLLPLVAKGFFLSNDTDAELAQSAEASPLVWGPPAATAFGCVVLFFYAGHIQDFLMPIVAAN